MTPAPDGRGAAPRLIALGTAATIAAFTAWAYAGVSALGVLHWDDLPFILHNPHLHDPGWPDLLWMFSGERGGNWQPLTWLSHALDLALFGDAAQGPHLVNAVLHGLAAVLFAWIAARLIEAACRGGSPGLPSTASIAGGGAAGLLFAVHPQHVEAVAWISERKELLCALFYLVAIAAYLRYVASRRGNWRWAAVGAHTLALLAKPMAVSLPVVLLLLDVFPLRRIDRRDWRRRVVEKWPHILLSALVVPVSVWSQGSVGALSDLESVGLPQRLLNAAHSLFLYPAKLLFPVNLVPFYPHPDLAAGAGTQSLWPAFALVLVAVVAVFAALRGARMPLIALAWYVVTLLPVLGLVQFGSHAAADRYAYLPTLPAYVLLGAGVSWAVLHGAGVLRAASVIAVVALAIGLGLLTRSLVPVWTSDLSLWSYTVARVPDAALPRVNLGNALFAEGDYAAAARHYESALASNPGHATARRNLALTYARLGRQQAAVGEYTAFVQSHPGAAEVRIELGMLLCRMQRWDEAASQFEKTLALDSSNADAHYGMAIVYAGRGKLDAAARAARRALALDPDHAAARDTLRRLGEVRAESVVP